MKYTLKMDESENIIFILFIDHSDVVSFLQKKNEFDLITWKIQCRKNDASNV